MADARYVDGGNVVVALFNARGHNDGPIGKNKATGRSLDLPCCEVLRYDDQGQVVEGWVYYDQLTMLTQLGLVKAPA